MAEEKNNQKKAGCGCGGLIGEAVVVLVILMIIGWLAPKDPNYEAGKQAGKSLEESMSQISSGYPREEQRRNLAKTMCLGNLSGEARSQWDSRLR